MDGLPFLLSFDPQPFMHIMRGYCLSLEAHSSRGNQRSGVGKGWEGRADRLVITVPRFGTIGYNKKCPIMFQDWLLPG